VSIQRSVLDALREQLDALGLCPPLSVGPTPPENGFALAIASGRSTARTLGGGETILMEVTITGKHQNHRTALDTLGNLQEAITALETLPSGDGWQMVAVRVSGAPAYVDREGAQWWYSAGLTVEYVTGE